MNEPVTSFLDGLSPSAMRALQHESRMMRKRFERGAPSDEVQKTYIPHPAEFEMPADHKLRDAFYKRGAAKFGVSYGEFVQLCSIKHGPRINRFNQWGRVHDEKQTTRTRLRRDSEEGRAQREARAIEFKQTVVAQAGWTSRAIQVARRTKKRWDHASWMETLNGLRARELDRQDYGMADPFGSPF